VAPVLHVVFKTHLDVGFTDFAGGVKRRYFDQYIPRALAVARELREAGGQDRFVWTTGSWLVCEYLEQADASQRRAAEEGILAGDLRWHGLPFTTHSELMDPDLFRFGLGIAAGLDRRFGVKTIAAKMTDVPGHTRSIIPPMVDAGLRFLHIGVNSASRPPAVPELFRWREPETGAEIMVMYHGSGYGSATLVPGLAQGLAFAHTDDNLGPQSREDVVHELARLRARYPGYEVHPSTLDTFAAALEPVRASLPVLQDEIGDTWIYGTASDPRKTAGFRALLALRRQWLAGQEAAAAGPAFDRFSRGLLMVAEHSWGLDQKTFLADYRNWSRQDFQKARRADTVLDGIPSEVEYARRFVRQGAIQSYRVMEASWLDHRAHLARAAAALAGTPLAAAAAEALDDCLARRPAPARHAPRGLGRTQRFGGLAVHFGRDGSIISMEEDRTGRQWASADHPLALFRYQAFSSDDFDRFLRHYNPKLDDPEIHSWGVPDFGRPGMGPEDAESAFFSPTVVAWERAGPRVRLDLRLPAPARERYGAPAALVMTYDFAPDPTVVHVELSWFDKPANRLPEAAWLSFSPLVEDPSLWEIEKMGRWLSPLEVVSGGGRTLHGVGSGARIRTAGTELRLQTIDAHLVSPGTPRALRLDDSLPALEGGMHFLLHGNLFGTNFPLWFEGDGRFRFVVHLGDP